MRVIKEACYKGTRILLGNTKRMVMEKLVALLTQRGFEEISMPVIQLQQTFKNKVGQQNNKLMFLFTDRANRKLCLAPEYTAVVQVLSQTVFKYNKDVKLFYIQECFRGKNPQAGRYRQFTQLGVEILNPSEDYTEGLITLAAELVKMAGMEDETISREVTRGLDYYEQGKGFEICCERLGSSKQICGEGGIGFAIGIDRLLSAPMTGA